MPVWSCADVLPHPPALVFAFLQRPANRVRLAPPHWSLQLLSGPDQVALGSRLVLRGRRHGISQTSELEVTALEQDRLLEEEQRRGLFRRWKHSFTLEPTVETGTCLSERIEWEGPGGMLGLLLTAAAIERELHDYQAHRHSSLLLWLGEETQGINP